VTGPGPRWLLYLSEFEIPADATLPEELQGEPPRELPMSVRFGPLAQSHKKIVWGLLVAGAVCLVLDQLPFVHTMALYILPLAYIKWLGLILGAVGIVTHLTGGEYKKHTRYVTEGQPGWGRVTDLALAPAMVQNGQVINYFFSASYSIRRPDSSELAVLNDTSRPVETHLKDFTDTRFRVGDYVPIVWLPGKFEKTVKIYDFLGLTEESDLVRFDSKKQSLLQLLALVLLLPLMFITLFWGLYSFGRYHPIEFDYSTQGLVPMIAGGTLGAMLAIGSWLFQLRKRRKSLERNEMSAMVGRAVELDYKENFLVRNFMRLVILSGSILMGAVITVSWCFTANALFDNSPEKLSQVDITKMTQVTHSYIFREYQLEYSWPGDNDDHKMLTTPEHLSQFAVPNRHGGGPRRLARLAMGRNDPSGNTCGSGWRRGLRHSSRIQNPQFLRQRERHVLGSQRTGFDRRAEAFDEKIEHRFDDDFRRTGSGGNENGLCALEPDRIDVLDAIDEVRFDAALAGEFGEPLAVGTVLAAEHQSEIGFGGQHRHGLLAVLCGVADIFLRRRGDVRESFPQPTDDAIGVVDAECCLCEIGDFGFVGDLQVINALRSLDQEDRLGSFAHRPDDLIVALVAD
jgi:hypothetical protein